MFSWAYVSSKTVTNTVNALWIETIGADKIGNTLADNSSVIDCIPVPWHAGALLPIDHNDISISLFCNEKKKRQKIIIQFNYFKIFNLNICL